MKYYKTLVFFLSLVNGYPTNQLYQESKPVQQKDQTSAISTETTTASNGYSVVEITNYKDGFYTIPIALGSAHETVNLVFDTGSSDLWVTNSTLCSGDLEIYCKTFGTFHSSSSTTLKKTGASFSDVYVDKTLVTSTQVQDTVQIGDLVFAEATFGVASTLTGRSQGIFGMNLKENPSSLTKRLKSAVGARNRGFGVYLGQEGDGNKGQVVFGGIDHAKIKNKLHEVLTINKNMEYTNQTGWIIKLNSLKLGDKYIGSRHYPATLDTGTTVLSLPTEIFKQLVVSFQATYNSTNWIFKKPLKQETLTFNFDNNAAIEIPSTSLYKCDSTNICTFSGVSNTTSSEITLGAFFLRYTYVYFDIESKTCLLGQTKFTTLTNIKPYIKPSVGTVGNMLPTSTLSKQTSFTSSNGDLEHTPSTSGISYKSSQYQKPIATGLFGYQYTNQKPIATESIGYQYTNQKLAATGSFGYPLVTNTPLVINNELSNEYGMPNNL